MPTKGLRSTVSVRPAPRPKFGPSRPEEQHLPWARGLRREEIQQDGIGGRRCRCGGTGRG